MESCTTEGRESLNNQRCAEIGWNVSGYIGQRGLRNLGLDIPRGKVTARQAVMLNKAAEELPSESDITRADDI